jgi:hypothetical protein
MPGLVGKQRSGKGGRTQANGSNIKMNEYSLTDKADKLPTDCFEGNGQGQQIIGIEDLDIEIRGDWDAHQNFFDSPPAFYPQDSYGSTSTGLLIYTNITDAVFWNVPQSTILSATNGTRVRDKVTVGMSASALPGWSRPTGSV